MLKYGEACAAAATEREALFCDEEAAERVEELRELGLQLGDAYAEIRLLKADAERYRWHRLATMQMYPTLYRSAAHYDLCADANETLIYENAIAQQKETP